MSCWEASVIEIKKTLAAMTGVGFIGGDPIVRRGLQVGAPLCG